MTRDSKTEPCNTFKDFMRLLHECKRKGYRFRLFNCPARVPNQEGPGRVELFALWWMSPSTSLWGPLSVVAKVHFQQSTDPWLPDTMVAQRIGMPLEMAEEIRAATSERPGHLLRLRERLLAAVGLEEVPHSQRRIFRRKKHGNKDPKRSAKASHRHERDPSPARRKHGSSSRR